MRIVARLVAAAVDLDVEAGRGQRVAQPLGPLDEGHAVGLALVEQAAGDRVGRVVEPVQVDVEERQAALRTPP